MQPSLAPNYARNSVNAADETSRTLTDRNGDTLHGPRNGEAKSTDWIRILLFGLWLAAVGALAWRHVIWRDEARALSFAIQGEDWIAMLRGLHGDGHPALWYFLLRSVHAITGRPEALGLVAFAVAVAAAWLLVWRSPFPRPLIGLILASHFFIYEFSVMARNYGIGMLILFALAIAYPKCRERGVALGALLFLLANCNVIATILAGAFLLFWFVESCGEDWPSLVPGDDQFRPERGDRGRGRSALFRDGLPDLQRRRRRGASRRNGGARHPRRDRQPRAGLRAPARAPGLADLSCPPLDSHPRRPGRSAADWRDIRAH